MGFALGHWGYPVPGAEVPRHGAPETAGGPLAECSHQEVHLLSTFDTLPCVYPPLVLLPATEVPLGDCRLCSCILHHWDGHVPLTALCLHRGHCSCGGRNVENQTAFRVPEFLQFLCFLWVSAQVNTLQMFLQMWQEGMGQVLCSTGSTAHREVCLPVTKCTGGQDSSGSWAQDAGSHSNHKGTVVGG